MERMREGITEFELKSIEHAEILEASQVDRDWWLTLERFPTSQERDRALLEKKLVPVSIPNEYFTCPSFIRSDENLQLLRADTKNFLLKVCDDLDKRTGFSKAGIRLSIISLYRSDENQDAIVQSEEWYRAALVGTSAHAAGAAFDISVRSHYQIDSVTGKMSTVNSWDDNSIQKYQPLIFEQLGDILSEYSSIRACNVIVENVVEGENYSPTCFHVCTSPEIANIVK